MPYAEAIATYGSDKPDLRCGMEIRDLSEAFRDSEFRVFKQIVADGGVVRGFAVPGGNKYSRSQLDVLVDQAKQMGFTGLIWVRPGEPPLSSVKALSEATLRPALRAGGRGGGRSAADGRRTSRTTTSKLLGQLRLADRQEREPAEPRGVRVPVGDRFSAARVDNDEDGRWYSMHHPFTVAARRGHRQARQPTRRGACKGLRPRAERQSKSAAAASVFTSAALQARVFQRLGISDEEAKLRFGFFLEALEYGTPPHGGIALGLDRIVAILAGESSIREVIAFPKTANAVDLMAGAPSPVDAKQLRELHCETS